MLISDLKSEKDVIVFDILDDLFYSIYIFEKIETDMISTSTKLSIVYNEKYCLFIHDDNLYIGKKICNISKNIVSPKKDFQLLRQKTLYEYLTYVIFNIRNIDISDIKIYDNKNISYGLIKLLIYHYVYHVWFDVHNSLKTSLSSSAHIYLPTLDYSKSEILMNSFTKLKSYISQNTNLIRTNDYDISHICDDDILTSDMYNERNYLFEHYFMNENMEKITDKFVIEILRNKTVVKNINNDVNNENIIQFAFKIVDFIVVNPLSMNVIDDIYNIYMNDVRYFVKYFDLFHEKRMELTSIIKNYNDMVETSSFKHKEEIVYYYVLIKYTFEYSWKYLKYCYYIRNKLECNNDFWKLISLKKNITFINRCKILDEFDTENFMLPTYNLLNIIKNRIDLSALMISDLIPVIPISKIHLSTLQNIVIGAYQNVDNIQSFYKYALKHREDDVFKHVISKNVGDLLLISKKLYQQITHINKAMRYNLQLFNNSYRLVNHIRKALNNPDYVIKFKHIEKYVTDEVILSFRTWLYNYMLLYLTYFNYKEKIDSIKNILDESVYRSLTIASNSFDVTI